jgi:beta-lactamase class A
MTIGSRTRGSRRRRRRLPILPVFSVIMLMIAIGLLVISLVDFSQRGDHLPSDISVAGIQVGGLTPAEAVVRWETAYQEPVVLYYEDSPILLDPASVGFRTNRDIMITQMQNVDQADGGFWLNFFNHLTQQELQESVEIPLIADYQASLLEQFLQDIAARYDHPPGTAGYDVATLTTYPGTQGFVLDIERAKQMIEAALFNPTQRTVILPTRNENSSTPSIDTLENLLVAYLDSQGFIYDSQTTVASVFILDLATGEEINLLGDVAFSAASTAKVGILIDYFRYLDFAPNQEEAWLMANSLLCSNNSSSNLIMQIIGNNDLFAGLEDVDQTEQYIGARNSFITAPFYLGVEGQQLGSIPAPVTSPNPNFNTQPDPYNQTTTEDLGTMFSMIYDCANYGSGLMAVYPDGEFTQQECRQMLNLMSANDLLRLLQGGIPAGTKISHKNGWLENVHGDAGIVFPSNGRDYVIAVFLWEDTDFFDYTIAWPLIEGISRAAWNYFSPEQALLAPRDDLPVAAQECEGNFLPPYEQLDLNNINGWRNP